MKLGLKDQLVEFLLTFSPALVLGDFAIQNLHDLNMLHWSVPPDQLFLRALIVAFPFGFGARYYQSPAEKHCGSWFTEKKGRLQTVLEHFAYFFVGFAFISSLLTLIAISFMPGLLDYYHALPLIVRIPFSYIGKFAWILLSGWCLWLVGFFTFGNACVVANEVWKIPVLFLVPLTIMYAGAYFSDVVEGWQIRKEMERRKKRRSKRYPAPIKTGAVNSGSSSMPSSPMRSETVWAENFGRTVQYLKTSGEGSAYLGKADVPMPYEIFTADDGGTARRIANRKRLVAIFKGRDEYGKYEFFALPKRLAEKLFKGTPVSPVNIKEEEILRYLCSSGKIKIRKNRYLLVDQELKSDIAKQLSTIKGENLFYVA
ncbi:MAG: hypothetical protein JRD69_09995 [Deltaproteobacteria bacterium]|nr:hypothetical protein [Deltaproteobacteria bacterium]